MGITMALQFAPPLAARPRHRLGRRPVRPAQAAHGHAVSLLLLGLALGVLLLTGVMTLPIMYAFALALGIVDRVRQPRTAGLRLRPRHARERLERGRAERRILQRRPHDRTRRRRRRSSWRSARAGCSSSTPSPSSAMIGALDAHPAPTSSIARAPATGSARHSPTASATWPSAPTSSIMFAMVFLVGAFGMNFPIFASTMAIEFGRGADGFGLLSSILAIGSLTGALLAARRDRARIRVVIGGTLLFARRRRSSPRSCRRTGHMPRRSCSPASPS